MSDPIDAHLAVLSALCLDADRLPTPRADGDREALRILLGARRDLTTASTAQVNRLRALLLGGDDGDRRLARAALTDAALITLARRRALCDADRQPAVRHAQIRRLAIALREARRQLKANRKELHAIVAGIAAGLDKAHPKARPETPEPAPAPATGIAYLQLVADAHHQQIAADERIEFHALYCTTAAPAEPSPHDDQLPGQLSIDDAFAEQHEEAGA